MNKLTKLLLIAVLVLGSTLGAWVISYAQSSPLDLAATQLAGTQTFRAGELSASNASRSSARTNQVGGTIRSHEALLDAGQENMQQAFSAMVTATGFYRAVNNRFLR